VPEIPASVDDPEIQASGNGIVFISLLTGFKDALVSKVARDRVGEELSKMMKGPNVLSRFLPNLTSIPGNDPLHSIRLINDLGLYRSIFSVIPPSISDTFSASPGPESSSLKAATILQAFVSSSTSVHPTLLQPLHSDPTCKPRLFLATALLPYLGISYRDAKGKSLPAVAYVLRECLKLGTQNHFLDGIPVLFDAYQVLRNPDIHDEERFNFVSPDSGERSVKTERGVIGNLLREKVVHEPRTGSDWRSSLLFSLVVELLPICDTVEELKCKISSRLHHHPL